MPSLETTLNRLTDIDAGWWPFLHLRPARDERMDARRLARMAAYYGVPFGLMVYAWYVSIGFMHPSLLDAVACVSASVVFFFVVSRFTFAVAWNRRADRLRRDQGRTPVQADVSTP